MLANVRAAEVGLPLLGGAVSPTEKTARVNIIPQAQEEVKRQIKPEGRAALRCSARVVRGQHSRGVVAFPYAPRAGGAYDSHHRTAGIAGCTRRCGGCVAARSSDSSTASRPAPSHS